MRVLHHPAQTKCNTSAYMTTLTLRSDHEKLVDALDDFRYWMLLPPRRLCSRVGAQEQAGATGDVDAASDQACAGDGG